MFVLSLIFVIISISISFYILPDFKFLQITEKYYLPITVLVTSISALIIIFIRLRQIYVEYKMGRLSIHWTKYTKTFDDYVAIKTRINITVNEEININHTRTTPLCIESLTRNDANLCSYLIQLPSSSGGNNIGIGSIIFEPIKNNL